MWPTGKGVPPATITVVLTGKAREVSTGKVAHGVVLILDIVFTDANGNITVPSDFNAEMTFAADAKGIWGLTIQGVPANARNAIIFSVAVYGDNPENGNRWTYVSGYTDLPTATLTQQGLPGVWVGNFTEVVRVDDASTSITAILTGSVLNIDTAAKAQGVVVKLSIDFRDNAGNDVSGTIFNNVVSGPSSASGIWQWTGHGIAGTAVTMIANVTGVSGTNPLNSLGWVLSGGGGIEYLPLSEDEALEDFFTALYPGQVDVTNVI